MTPELKILTINLVILLVAYLGIYPAMRPRSVSRMMPTDLALTVLSLVTAGALFAGSGTRFSLLLFHTNWWIFAILTFALMEIPLLLWFCRRHGIGMEDDP